MQIIQVAILENLQSIIDGYHYRLDEDESIEICAVARFGKKLEGMLANNSVDILLMEPCVPVSDTNRNTFPVWTTLYKVLKRNPTLQILLITNNTEAGQISQAVEVGVNGYIYKDDAETIRSLPAVIKLIASGGIHFSLRAHNILRDRDEERIRLTRRQLQALSLCAAYPDDTAKQLAKRMNIAPSTFRSILSNAYEELNTHSRMAAVAEARRRGWIT